MCSSDLAVKRAWAGAVLGWVTPWEVLVLHPFFADFSSRLFFFADFASAFVRILTDAREAGGSGPVNTTPELSVPGRVRCQDG